MIPIVADLMSSHGEMVVLIKPQFEADREDVSEGGIVDNPEVHQEVIERIQEGHQSLSRACRSFTEEVTLCRS